MSSILVNRSTHPRPSVDQLFGLELLGAAGGRSFSVGRIPLAQVHHGWLAPLADLAAATAFTGTLPEGMTCVTVSLRLDCVGGAPHLGDAVSAHANLVESRDGMALVQAQIVRGDGGLIANVVARFIAVDGPSGNSGYADRNALGGETDLVTDVAMNRGSLEPDAASYFFTDPGSFANPLGVLHGGVQMTLVDIAVRDWLSTKLGRTDMHTADLGLRYLRPVRAEGKLLALEFRAERIGNRVVNVSGMFRTGTSDEAATVFEMILSV